MKELIFLFLLVFLFPCKLDKQQSINGNWYTDSNLAEIENYSEFYIDDTNLYIYNEDAGLLPNIEYLLKNDTLYFLSKDKDEAIGSVKFIDDNTLKIYNDSLFLRRIKKGIKPGDFLFGNKTESDYRKDFLERKKQWLLRVDN
ncbi:hypothetical protein [Hanstruepera flava]|uniref:hypothetical protein n=1 Tax=Hanstruepera flava TaxID=2930218 RepID=UPI0020279997|nr:hypothetical protein [Hanstruepera flava]